MTDPRDLTNPPPTELWIGTERGRWPIVAFGRESQVTQFLGDEDPGHPRRAWKVDDFTLTELELIPPSEPELRVRGAEPEQRCHVIDVDGEPAAIHGHGPITPEAETAIAEVVRAARRRLADGTLGPHLGIRQELILVSRAAGRDLHDAALKTRLNEAVRAACDALAPDTAKEVPEP